MFDVALASCDAYLDLHPDDRLLREALEARGLSTTVVSWSYEGYDWSRVRCCLPRNTWDARKRARDFEDWVGRTAEATRLWNPAPVLRWNLDAGYLDELEDGGVPILPRGPDRRTSLVYLEGGFSHAVLRKPGGGDQEIVEPALPREDEVRVATAALAAARARSGIEEELLYARADLARDEGDVPCLLGLELIEPTLYLRVGEGSADRLANAVFARLA